MQLKKRHRLWLISLAILLTIGATVYWHARLSFSIDSRTGADPASARIWETDPVSEVLPLTEHAQETTKQKQNESNVEMNKQTPPPKETQPAVLSDPMICLVYSDNYLIRLMGLELLHPFDIHKYKKIHDRLVKDGLITTDQFFKPDEITREQILLVQSESLLASLRDKQTLAGYLEAPQLKILPLSMVDKGILRAFRYSSGGTLLAARMALQSGIGINLGGGYHHAKIDTGEGFCIYADVPIAIRCLQQEKLIERALVIDVDVHQGNGTAVCLRHDDSTFTFSMHETDIYPIPKEVSDWDEELPSGMQDEAYNNLLRSCLPRLFEKSRPDIVFVIGGCDTLAGDPLANLLMTEAGIVTRDQLIVDACAQHRVPVVLTLAGGYSPDAWHVQYASIKNLLQKYSLANNPAKVEGTGKNKLN
jgi:histone deacetylase 11